VTVSRFLAEEMLRVTELTVRVVRVAGVAVIGRSESGMLLGVVIGELVVVSAAPRPNSEHWPVIVYETLVCRVCGDVVVVGP
jgi:hypothetical protein